PARDPHSFPTRRSSDLKTGWLSTFATDVRGMPTKFIGLDNYIDNLSSEGFRSSLWATLLFTVMVVPDDGDRSCPRDTREREDSRDRKSTRLNSSHVSIS